LIGYYNFCDIDFKTHLHVSHLIYPNEFFHHCYTVKTFTNCAFRGKERRLGRPQQKKKPLHHPLTDTHTHRCARHGDTSANEKYRPLWECAQMWLAAKFRAWIRSFSSN